MKKISTMSYLTHLECSVCSTRYDPRAVQTVCRECGRSLLARYNLGQVRKDLNKDHLRDRESSMWRYRELLPVFEPANTVSLGEGFTPLLPLRETGSRAGIGRLLMKEEGMNPTGSFKARGLAMAVSKAKELAVRELCVPTAGNAGGALAAYAASAGIAAHIYMPADTPEVNVVECKSYGADVHQVHGVISDAATAMQKERQPGWFDVSTLKEPYRVEGKKTLGYEIAEQLGWILPDVVVYPTGGGTGLIGMWKAFAEMEELGWIGPARPRMVAVQSTGCAPVVRAWEAGEKATVFWENAATLASGLRVPRAFADHLILDAVSDSRGSAVAVSDSEIIAAITRVASEDGVLLCPEGAATVAALPGLAEKQIIQPSDTVVVFNTGSGLKYLEVLREMTGE